MTKIAVFSDIHIPVRIKKFPYKKVKPLMHDIDIIFGLGDYNSQEGLDDLLGFSKKVFCVKGNMDPISLSLPDKLILNIEDIVIGLIHGWGTPIGLRKRIKKEFTDVDLICYGHTHSQFWGNEDGIHYFNPGAICGKEASFGILSIDKSIDENISVKFIKI